jgi:pimeloyl-ACP methyl ester carboxylesterase
MLIVNGASDPLNPGAGSEQLAEFGTLVHEIVLPEAGHFPMLESADSFHRLMIDFLALDSGSSPRDLRLKEGWHRRMR